MSRNRVFRAATTALLASSCLVAVAHAQEAVATSEDEIIVTAQKRSENMQAVPISIQALGTQKLEQLNIANFGDYTKMLPSVAFQTNQAGGNTVYFRGVASGGDGNHSGSLPSVGVYLDEQPVTTVGGTLDVHVYDIARIEALAGPQGTLYGASSEAGTIRIITNRPSTRGFDAAINVELNSVRHGDQGGKIEGFVNAPLSESIALRVVGFYQHDAGFIDNVPGTRSFLGDPVGSPASNSAFVKKDFNDADIAGGRAALKIDLDEDWTATASVIGQDSKSRGAFGYDPRTGDLQVQHFSKDFIHDRFIQAALTIEGKIGNWDLTYAGAYMKRRTDSAADYIDYAEAYDSFYADSGGVAGYFYVTDNAGDPIVLHQRIIGRDDFNKLSQELRIASPQDAPLRAVAGAFYQRQYHRIHQDYKVTGLADAMSVNGFPGTLWLTQQDRIDKDYALFGELSYDILETLTLTGGLRAYKFDNSLIGFFGFGRDPNGPPYNGVGSSRTGVAGCYTTTGTIVRDDPTGTLAPAAVPGSPCTNLADFVNGKLAPKRTKDNGTIHRLNLTWKASSDKLLYLTWSRGFRPGGINRRSSIQPYAADFLTNYEFGFKTSWLDRRLRINGAFFWQDWKDFQYAFLGANSFTEIHNGPNARIKGAEFDVSLRATDRLTLSANGTYTDAKIRKNLCGFDDPTFTCALPGPDGGDNFVSAPKGTRLPITPRFKGTMTGRYEYPLAGGTAHFQTVVAHQGSAASDLRTRIVQIGTGDFINPAAGTGRLKSFTSVDFAFGIDWQHFSAELFLENAFDERAQLSRYIECGQCFQRPYVVTNTPQTIGLRGGYKF